MVDNIKIVGKIGQFTQTRTDEPKLDMTIGLWHQSIPKWDFGTYDDYLNNKLGFQKYATDYVNYVKNIIEIGKSKGINQGEFYFLVGDPTTDPFKYLSTNPFGSNNRPIINQYLINKLAEAGVKKFGLIVGDPGTAWSWVSEKYPNNKIIKGETQINGLTINQEVYIEKLFKLISELNDELEKNYNTNNTDKNERLYIHNIGFDNESFGKIYERQGVDKNGNCPSGSEQIITPSNIINYLWDNYFTIDKEWYVKDHKWGISGQSPPLMATCKADLNNKSPIPNSSRDYAFIEYYNVFGNASAIRTFDHPCFIPQGNEPLWVSDVNSYYNNGGDATGNPGHINPTNASDNGQFNSYYGLNTPLRRLNAIYPRYDPGDLVANGKTDIFKKIYEGNKPSIFEIITGAKNISTMEYPLTKYNDITEITSSVNYNTYIENIYGIMNQYKQTISNNSITPKTDYGNWRQLAADYNKMDQNTPYKDVSDNTRWMLSIENYSSAFGTINKEGVKQLNSNNDNIITKFNKEYIDISSDNSSIALKYGSINPFELVNNYYNLYHIQNSSGTFEAFGGWELDQMMDLMIYSYNTALDTKSKKVVKNFMLYEFNFAKVGHCNPNYADKRIN